MYIYRQYNAFVLKYGNTDMKVHHILNITFLLNFHICDIKCNLKIPLKVHVHVKIVKAPVGVELLSCRSVADFHLLGYAVVHQNCESYERNNV